MSADKSLRPPLEQDNKPAMPIYGRACTLWPRTLELYDQLDVCDAILDVGVVSKTGLNFKECVVLTPGESLQDLANTLLAVERTHQADSSLATAWTGTATLPFASREQQSLSAVIFGSVADDFSDASDSTFASG